MEFDIKPDPQGISVKPMTRTLLVPESVINLQFIERWPTPLLHELERESLQQTELAGGVIPGNVREHAADHVRADLQAKALSMCHFVWGRWRGDGRVMDGRWQLFKKGEQSNSKLMLFFFFFSLITIKHIHTQAKSKPVILFSTINRQSSGYS